MVVNVEGCYIFHVNGTVVECRGNRTSQEWKDMMQYAGRDVTLFHALKLPNLAYPVPSCYAEIQDVPRLLHTAKLRVEQLQGRCYDNNI